MICQKSPTFAYSYSNKNILTTICQKSPTFGYSNSTRNILTMICQKSPTLGSSNRTRNILTEFSCKIPSYGFGSLAAPAERPSTAVSSSFMVIIFEHLRYDTLFIILVLLWYTFLELDHSDLK